MPEMERKTCNICGKNKKISKFYKHRAQCKRCYLDKKKQNVTENVEENMLRHDMDLINSTVMQLQEDIKHRDVAMNYHQQITAKMENAVQNLTIKLDGESDKNSALSRENDTLRTNVAMLQEKISALELENSVLQTKVKETDKSLEKIQKTATNLGSKVVSHREMQLELGDVYYKFIMGIATKYEVQRRLSEKGYLDGKKK